MKYKKETRELFNKAKRELRSAEVLLKDGDNDGAVSRSYYAMFHSAQAVLLTKELTSKKHSTTIAWFNQHFVKTGVFHTQLAKNLNNAERLRKSGDYGYPFLVKNEEAKETIENAKEFVKQTKQHTDKEN